MQAEIRKADTFHISQRNLKIDEKKGFGEYLQGPESRIKMLDLFYTVMFLLILIGGAAVLFGRYVFSEDRDAANAVVFGGNIALITPLVATAIIG